jgi:hypothetical protein
MQQPMAQGYRAPAHVDPGERVIYQEPGVAITTWRLVVGPTVIPLAHVRQAQAGAIAGSVIGRAARVAGWFVVAGGCAGCVGAPGFAGIGMLVTCLVVQLLLEWAYRQLGGKPTVALVVQLASWQTLHLPLPPRWSLRDAEGLAFDVNKQIGA